MKILNRSCPNCGNSISIRSRLVLLKQLPLTCSSCSKSLSVKSSIKIIHSFTIGFLCSWSIKHFTDLDFIWALSVALFIGTFLKPAIDILFELEEDDSF